MLGIVVDRSKNQSISRQIYDQIRAGIMSGNLPSGFRLPPSRRLAEALSVSRNIIIEVYDQLLSEGFVMSRTGAGTFVSPGIGQAGSQEADTEWNMRKREYRKGKADMIDFASGLPDLGHFPFKAWEKCLKEAYDTEPEELFDYGPIAGDPELRECISDYLFRSRGVRCSPENIMITSGASQAFLMISKAMEGLFEVLDMEDPSVDFIRDIFLNTGFTIRPVHVDDEGACIDEIIRTDGKKLIFLTPSFQFPTGSILSIQRKQALLKWVRDTGSIVIEDGYDSEFRYRGMLAPPLLSMDYDHIIYVGTFSKNLSPGIRLGYVIIPPLLRQAFKQVKLNLNMYCSQIDQKTLARFIGNGCLERHIYLMKKVYRKKQQTLVGMIRKYLGSRVGIGSNDAGMHLIVEIPDDVCGKAEWNGSHEFGVRVYPMSDYYYGGSMEPGSRGSNDVLRNRLILGYGNLSLEEIEEGIKRLHRFIRASAARA